MVAVNGGTGVELMSSQVGFGVLQIAFEFYHFNSKVDHVIISEYWIYWMIQLFLFIKGVKW